MLKNDRKNRITDIILDHWNELRDVRKFPSESELDLGHLSSIWDNCFLVQTRDVLTKENYNYTYLGKNIIDAYGRDLTNMSIMALASEQADHISFKYEEVIRTGTFMYDEGEFLNAKKMKVKYRQVLVPLGDDNCHVQSILGGMRYKLFK
ncbi:PAS domain-containing protein [Rickettsiales bacterium]|nr:PAS domain-containing protein [Rickettsiales bacterium]